MKVALLFMTLTLYAVYALPCLNRLFLLCVICFSDRFASATLFLSHQKGLSDC